jgi:hypothetical protein
LLNQEITFAVISVVRRIRNDAYSVLVKNFIREIKGGNRCIEVDADTPVPIRIVRPHGRSRGIATEAVERDFFLS